MTTKIVPGALFSEVGEVPFDSRTGNVNIILDLGEKGDIVVLSLESGPAGWPPPGTYKLLFSHNGPQICDGTVSIPPIGFPYDPAPLF